MPRQRATSNGSDPSMVMAEDEQTQELGSMYDYLAKIILLGPSGAGKSCLLHRFLRSSFPPLSSQTIGVEFGSKIVSIGGGPNRKRIKLQLWDTAGTERFRAVSRSYYRGAAGALLVYDVSSWASFGSLGTFLKDVRALGSSQLSLVLVGNKVDVEELEAAGAAASDRKEVGLGLSGAGSGHSRPSTAARSLISKSSGSFAQADSDVWGADGTGDYDSPDWNSRNSGGISIPNRNPAVPSHISSSSQTSIPPTPSSASSMQSTSTIRYTGQQSATRAPQGREVDQASASKWASTQSVPVSMDVSAFSGEGVEEAFARLARMILTKIELGEIDPDDPASGIQYGDRGWWDGNETGSVQTTESSTLRHRRKVKSRSGTSAGLRDWEAVFRVDVQRAKRRGCC